MPVTSHDEFKCKRLNQRMTAGKCLRLQDEAIAMFGANRAAKCSTCPCDQGTEIRREMEMAKKKERKICQNCGRLMMIAQGGLCGGCWCRTRGLAGEAKDEAMEKAKRDFGGIPEGKKAKPQKYYRGPRVLQSPPETPALSGTHLPFMTDAEPGTFDLSPASIRFKAFAPGLVEAPPPAVITVVVPFREGDETLFNGLIELGKKYRRAPDQQILWLLEKELDIENIEKGMFRKAVE